MENKIIDEDSGEIMPDKSSNKPWLFKKGTPKPEGSGRQKGQLNKTTQLLNEIGITNVKQLKKYMDGVGVARFIKELEQLEGKDYIVAYLGLLPYVRGKVANVEVIDDEDRVHKLTTTHTVTIRDMRDGSTMEII